MAQMTPDEAFDMMHGPGMLARVRALVNDLAPCTRRDSWWDTDGPYEIIARHMRNAMDTQSEIVGRNILPKDWTMDECIHGRIPDAPSTMSGNLPPKHPNWGKILDEQCESAVRSDWMDRCKPPTAAGSGALNVGEPSDLDPFPAPSVGGNRTTR